MGRRSTGTVEALRTCIRLKFTWNGERCVETLDLTPTPGNIRSAEKLMQRVQAAIAVGSYRRGDFFAVGAEEPAAKESFAEVADRWFKAKTGAKSTLVNYGWSKDRWKVAFEGKAIDDIRHSDIAAVIKEMADGGASGKTINNQLTVIRGIYELAEADETVTRNPTAKIKQQKHQAPPPDPFDRDEMEAILAYMARHHPEPIFNYFETSFGAGLRPSEQIIAPWDKVDWNRAQLRIDRALVLWEEKDTKTHAVRDVDLTDRVVAALTRQKAFTFMKGGDVPIFCNPLSGAPWADEQRQRRAYFQPALRALGIRARDAYNTRHTYATLALMGGVNPAYLARQLGHTTTAMVFKVYSRWIDGADKGAEAGKLNALMGPHRAPKRDGQTG